MVSYRCHGEFIFRKLTLVISLDSTSILATEQCNAGAFSCDQVAIEREFVHVGDAGEVFDEPRYDVGVEAGLLRPRQDDFRQAVALVDVGKVSVCPSPDPSVGVGGPSTTSFANAYCETSNMRASISNSMTRYADCRPV